MLSWNLLQNSAFYLLLLHLFLLEHFSSSSSVLFCNLWQCVLLICIYSTSQYSFLSLVFCNILLKHLGFLFLKFSLDFLISMGIPHPLYIVSDPVLQSCHPSVDSQPCPTEVIATFHSLSVSGTAIGKYPSIILIISAHIFFFNKKIVCNSFVLAFIASTLNSIIKYTMFFFPFLKISILHLASTCQG